MDTVERDVNLSGLPAAQGLYDPVNERDACGVGFVCQLKGEPSHLLVSDAKYLLCNMTHRGATGADSRDGDGAGVMVGMPDEFFRWEAERELQVQLPKAGEYAAGNVFFKKGPEVAQQKVQFETIAESLNLRVLGWRSVPVDNTILGPASLSREPEILQPFVVLSTVYGTGNTPAATGEGFDEKYFERQLFVLRKHATHTFGLSKGFYICSLSNKNIVYKGQLTPNQVYAYYYDLNHSRFKSHFTLVHSRFSTNTFPSWERAQPMRWAAHNGEINTVRGNMNWMRAREGNMASTRFGDELDLLYPIVEAGGSDSAAFDNVLELLVVNNVVTLPEAVMMMVPEAWQNNPDMDPKKAAFYQWASCLMEPWDGPALFTFSDGRYCGANLDRNGLRPCRWILTDDDIMICGSEVGAISIDPRKITRKGRLQPGRMLLVDTEQGRIVDDSELKQITASRNNYAAWVESQMLTVPGLIDKQRMAGILPSPYDDESHVMNQLDSTTVGTDPRLRVFGYTIEQVDMLLKPIVSDGKEALGSMGNDRVLACMANGPRLTYEYFRELFAQVTNPPIDPIREAIVMSLECTVGNEGNLLSVAENQCHRLKLTSPILSRDEINAVLQIHTVQKNWKSIVIDITFDKAEGLDGYEKCLDRINAAVTAAIAEDYKIIVLSDRAAGKTRVPVSALVAVGGVHHHLVRTKQRSKVAIIADTGEAREVHHMCVLLGYGADAVSPYLAFEVMFKLKRENLLKKDLSEEELVQNFKYAVDNGILKVMSKMGISTLQSYKGAQIFEALGLDDAVINKCFAGTASRIGGATFHVLASDAFEMHDRAYPDMEETVMPPGLPEEGDYHWRDGADSHVNDPTAIAKLQDAARNSSEKAYADFSKVQQDAVERCTLRGLLDFRTDDVEPIPIEQVEPWHEIAKRFVTGAMSYGSISIESHATLALAMNRIGGKSNTGEGGEDAARSEVLPGGDSMRSAIKQVASGRFGVTSHYLSDADELQIKMAQGAKPGEGGELPGHKVSASIAAVRHSTEGVGLISPPPHHDIYSIEDLKQLIYDLKCANPRARVSVKLVSEVGVGVVASGVAKAKADHVLISGHDGGTGASRWTGIKYAGLPWELGLADAHQTLVLNDLRVRVTVQTDGQLRTGRDVAMACLLGAEEFGFATAPLIALGCIMMRRCELNVCPVGIATQDPVLRAKFAGQPEHVVNYLYFVTQELRQIMASLGLRTMNEMVGRADLLRAKPSHPSVRAQHLNLDKLLTPAWKLRKGAATFKTVQQDFEMHTRLDNKLVAESEEALEKGLPVRVECDINNLDRAVGTSLSNRVSKKYGGEGLPPDTIRVKLHGSAGQSLGAFLAPGITLEIEGDANDYVGKGLSGGRIIAYPPKNSVFKPEENVIVGNVCLYGATSGQAYFQGMAAERFAVRNSGVTAVVEGVGDHGCEYMTGGRVVVLGYAGRNFAAGMSGGIAYILDMARDFKDRVNKEQVELSTVNDPHEIAELRLMIEDHLHWTGSSLADRILRNFNKILPNFVRVMPHDYKLVLEEREAKARAEREAKKEQTLRTIVPIGRSSVKLPPGGAQSNESFLEGSSGSSQASSSSSGSPPTSPDMAPQPEPSVLDMEDSMVDVAAQKKKQQNLDKVRGFMKYNRLSEKYRNPRSRVKDWAEISNRLSDGDLRVQAARCMNCGVPFCQSDTGCPISNIIPRWNDLVFREQWRDALDRLLMTNNFPEFTGRVCPAPCEGACVLGINELPVGIKSIECAIIDKGFEMGWMVPKPPLRRSGRSVAIIGSGPAGLAAADQLNKAGHTVAVYERADRCGGLLIYGIPNPKLDKRVVQRRLDLMKEEGVQFVTQAHIGVTHSATDILAANDALVLATGATWPRDLKIPNRDLSGIHFAMEFLHMNTASLLNSNLEDDRYISAKGKDVIVIGGGDTGNDCIGTSIRHGAKSITNFELLPTPPGTRADDNPWPQWPKIFRVDYGHTEVSMLFGNDPREYSISAKEFVSDGNGNVKGINTVRVHWEKDITGAWRMQEAPGTERFFPADLVLISMGFLGPENEVLKSLGVAQDPRSNIKAQHGNFATNVPGVFAAGDCRRGQSLIVWGINEGRGAAASVDKYLQGQTRLPLQGSFQPRIQEIVF